MDIQAYGTWSVTTEGDCEGRTTNHLGTHTGYLDEIAFALADKAYYELRFEYVDPDRLKRAPPKATKVDVSLTIESGTWQSTMDGFARVAYFKELLRGRDVLVREGSGYAGVTLVNGMSPEAQQAARKKVLIASAISKLSQDELEALKGE